MGFATLVFWSILFCLSCVCFFELATRRVFKQRFGVWAPRWGRASKEEQKIIATIVSEKLNQYGVHLAQIEGDIRGVMTRLRTVSDPRVPEECLKAVRKLDKERKMTRATLLSAIYVAKRYEFAAESTTCADFVPPLV